MLPNYPSTTFEKYFWLKKIMPQWPFNHVPAKLFGGGVLIQNGAQNSNACATNLNADKTTILDLHQASLDAVP